MQKKYLYIIRKNHVEVFSFHRKPSLFQAHFFINAANDVEFGIVRNYIAFV
ncbi:hypothetical protein QFZ81_005782 [Paenibacillus sp. V4I9]|nr:hypothetical protein [Paenibacillus sp. V4I9]